MRARGTLVGEPAGQKCDLWVGQPYEWLIEIKMARLRGDNGKPDDTPIKDVFVAVRFRPERPG